MEKSVTMVGFDFKFKSNNPEVDALWNDCNWDDFNSTDSVPLVGDNINFWYIFSEMQENKDGLKSLLSDYNTAIFKVTQRTYTPLYNRKDNYEKIGTWSLYTLTIEPIKDEKLQFHLSQVAGLVEN